PIPIPRRTPAPALPTRAYGTTPPPRSLPARGRCLVPLLPGVPQWHRHPGGRRIKVHDTRRTCASLLVALDVHPRVAMQILRHSRIAVTIYRR
ncbi:site-specific integrase, partial [Nonomuraea cypriaca]|uniref:hypothetical protein n=1 Tax=Nonomuraea cypriaca TaxID=1187855 RepID=UPI0038B3CE9C